MLSPKKGTNNMQLPSIVTTTTPCFHNKVWQVSKQVWKKVKWGEDRKLELNWAGIIYCCGVRHIYSSDSSCDVSWLLHFLIFQLTCDSPLAMVCTVLCVCGPKRGGGKNQPKKPFPNDFVLADFFLDTIRCVLL